MPKDEANQMEKPDIRKANDGKEWRLIEKYYQKKVKAIRVPHDLSPRGILRINAKIDRVYSEARFDAAFARERYEFFKEKYMLAKKQANLHFKQVKGITAEDREALVLTHLETTPLPGFNEPILTLVERWRKRKIFMDAVIDTLLQKSGMMINGNGALKLDAQGRGDVEGDDE
jgi:hypothetical protein